MQFHQGKDRTGKVRLDAKEHFILANFISRIPIYALMWAFILLASWALSCAPFPQPVTDYPGMRAFSIAFTTIATTTITFAIPTCMRAIFSTYEQYYSTQISKILLDRFPVTLLSLSAFTSLIVSVSIVSGIMGVSIEIPPALAFYVSLFWTLVCIFYLFVAIEKMVYFIANAPYAVIEKLEYGVAEIAEIRTKEEYDRFRQELASINDIASTILSKSTGYDASITESLSAFVQIHSHYLATADPSRPSQFRFQMNACRAVGHELVRMFRTSCASKNEKACADIIGAYCEMLEDALSTDTNIGYFSDMLAQVSKFSSYAESTSIEEIKVSASISWFFELARMDTGDGTDDRERHSKNAAIVRTLTANLRSATENGDDATIVKFLRIASNSEVDFDILGLAGKWKDMLDRAVFVYATWLVDLLPSGAERFLEYVNRYSRPSSELFRSVLPDDEQRLSRLLSMENMLRVGKAEESGASDGVTAMVLSLNLDTTSAHSMMIADLLGRNELPVSYLGGFPRLADTFSREISHIRAFIEEPEMQERLSLAKTLYPGLYGAIDGFNEEDLEDTGNKEETGE